ncbi:hypothetical protein ACFLVQ_00775 [Chloroflexota bacterium]
MAIGHFAVGASATMVAYNLLPFSIRTKTKVAQFFIFALGGLWAMAPDLSKFTDEMRYLNDKYWIKIELFRGTIISDFTVLINRIEALHQSNWANIFFLHRIMDIADNNDSALVSGVLIFCMISLTAFFLMKEIIQQRLHKND